MFKVIWLIYFFLKRNKGKENVKVIGVLNIFRDVLNMLNKCYFYLRKRSLEINVLELYSSVFLVSVLKENKIYLSIWKWINYSGI